mmetsp:Transcript_66957/g.178166  ORF Transcript_66957/g.178166 Transcript_66957/m.178166 type:complete len:200 (+) Transcript_66957:549-1148(+)
MSTCCPPAALTACHPPSSTPCCAPLRAHTSSTTLRRACASAMARCTTLPTTAGPSPSTRTMPTATHTCSGRCCAAASTASWRSRASRTSCCASRVWRSSCTRSGTWWAPRSPSRTASCRATLSSPRCGAPLRWMCHLSRRGLGCCSTRFDGGMWVAAHTKRRCFRAHASVWSASKRVSSTRTCIRSSRRAPPLTTFSRC